MPSSDDHPFGCLVDFHDVVTSRQIDHSLAVGDTLGPDDAAGQSIDRHRVLVIIADLHFDLIADDVDRGSRSHLDSVIRRVGKSRKRRQSQYKSHCQRC